jgi:ceramide glucosyltransferase
MDWYPYIAWTAIAAQLLFLYHAVRNYHYARSKSRKKRSTAPRARVALIVPCKGLDARFHTNIASFLRQDHENHHLFFVVGEQSDPAYAELCRAKETLGAESRASEIQILVAGSVAECGVRNAACGVQSNAEPADATFGIANSALPTASGPPTSRSQKIHNLLYALERVPDGTDVFAFADSDICVHSDWLSSLVRPLRRSGRGVTTGYRWYVPTRNNLATLAMSAMNAGVAQLLGNSHFNQAWGGSMAIRADDFRRLDLPRTWRNTLSDDLSLSRAVKQARMKVIFVPACLVPSFETTTWRALCEFARRQFLITRVYVPGSWWVGLLSSLGSVLGLWGGAMMAAFVVNAAWVANGYSALRTPHSALLLSLAVPVVFLVGQIVRAVLRQATAARILREYRDQLRPAAVADILGGWLWSPLLLLLILSSAFGRTIRWRGIRYKLHGPDQTEVL